MVASPYNLLDNPTGLNISRNKILFVFDENSENIKTLYTVLSSTKIVIMNNDMKQCEQFVERCELSWRGTSDAREIFEESWAETSGRSFY